METPDDLAQEQEMADKLAKLWHCEMKKLPKNYHIDYAIMQGKKVIGFAEIPRRNINSDAYPETFLSLKKWIGLNDVSKATGLPVYWCVQYNDKMCIIKAENNIFDIGINGNVARGYENSFEPVVNIPIEKLKEVTEKSWADRVSTKRVRAIA